MLLIQADTVFDPAPKPALNYLQACLEELSVAADPVRVATVFLMIFQEKMPGQDPERLVDWMRHLARDIHYKGQR